MTDSLLAPAPGFDQPIAVLKHCHDKIRQQQATVDARLDVGALNETVEVSATASHWPALKGSRW